MKRAIVLLADGFEEVEAITQIDFLRRAGIETVVAGVTGRDVVGSHDIRVNTDITVDEWSGTFDAIVIPGGARGAENIAADVPSMTIIRRALQDGKLVAAICAAPGVVLGANGLLGTRRFTSYPGFESLATGGSFVEDRVVVDGNLVTSRGPGTAAEFAEAIVTYLIDP
jgi:4-methyl-5(b-hydroxyethyl)-thiazole monophosphate biosynthesis